MKRSRFIKSTAVAVPVAAVMPALALKAINEARNARDVRMLLERLTRVIRLHAQARPVYSNSGEFLKRINPPPFPKELYRAKDLLEDNLRRL